MTNWSVESRMRGNAHVRFGGAGRGNGPRAIRYRASARPYAESFFGTLQVELLDRRSWKTRHELALAIFEYLEAFYNPVRRHSSLGYLSPVEFEGLHKRVAPAA